MECHVNVAVPVRMGNEDAPHPASATEETPRRPPRHELLTAPNLSVERGQTTHGHGPVAVYM